MGHKLDLFMAYGPYVDYPFENVMFRWNAEHKVMLKKHYGSDQETIVGWTSGLLNEMLAFGGAEPLTEEEYRAGKESKRAHPTAEGYRRRRKLFAFDQALYVNTYLSFDAYAAALGLETQFRSEAPTPDWLTADTQPQTTVQTSASTGIHPAAEGHVDPDLEVLWNERREAIGDPATYELQVDALVKSIEHPDVSGGLYIANSTRAVWWNNVEGVTVTDDAATLTSLPGQTVLTALEVEDIQYRRSTTAHG